MTDLKVSYLLALLFLVFISFNVKAEGSKDLYPNGALGARASMYATVTTDNHPSFPFKTRGTHYVYVKAGEWICVGSSIKGMTTSGKFGGITLTSPNGVVITSTSTVGQIKNRVEELNGPSGPNEAATINKYTPFYHKVLVNQAGIWRVEFSTPNDPDPSPASGPNAVDVLANSSWTQDKNDRFILAWDISVRNTADNDWVKGRVYANVLNLGIAGEFKNSNKSYHGKNYVLTRDGRAYFVNNNGNNGYGFTFFANNKGFIDGTGAPLYKSLNFSDQTIVDHVHDPRIQDDLLKNLITHKLFYNPPAADLPADANVCINGVNKTTTWLKREAIVPVITNVKFKGAEDTPDQAGQKGGYITFDANVPGTYRIVIPIPGGVEKVLTGSAVKDENIIKWDGTDGIGVLVPANTIIPEVRVRLTSSEVHFPFLDMEINPNGIIIELTKNDGTYGIESTSLNESIYSDRVYWDDSDIVSNDSEKPYPIVNTSIGISSKENGHIWSSYINGSGSSYGDAKAMDTWAYMLSDDAATPLNVSVKVADLKITSIYAELTGKDLGSTVTYRVTVENKGPSNVSGAKFAFAVPVGLQIDNVDFMNTGSCGAQSSPVINSQSVSAKLDLPNNCKIDYVITGTITQAFPLNGFGVEVSIMRPNDVTDPDASNQIFENTPPTDPHEECRNGTAVEVCNNIKYNIVKALDFCVGTSIPSFAYELATGGVNYTISGKPLWLNAEIIDGKVVFTGTPTSTGIFNFTVGTLGNERENTTYLILVHTLPVFIKHPQSVTVCEGSNAVFSVESADTDTYQWQYLEGNVWKDFTDAGSIAGSTTSTLDISAVPLTYNEKKIRVIVSSALGCSTISDEVILIVNDIPTKPVIAGTRNICEDGSVLLTADPVNAKGYQWYFNGVLIPNENSYRLVIFEHGTYTLAIKNELGCWSVKSDPKVINLVLFPKPVINHDDLMVCAGNKVRLTTGLGAMYQWLKDGQDIPGATDQEYIAEESGEYSVIITNAIGCERSSDRVTVEILAPLPVPTISVDQDKLTFCEGGSIELISSSAAGNQWYKDGNEIAGATDQKYVATESGIYTVRFTDANGCYTVSAGVTVLENQLPPPPSITVDQEKLTFCEGGSVELVSSASTGNQWYKDGNEITGATDQKYVATESGIYTVRFTDVNGCYTVSAGVTVLENQLPPPPSITVDQEKLTFCEGGSVELISSSAAGNQWYKDGNEITGATDQKYVATESGIYTVRFTDVNGCYTVSAGVTVVENQLPPPPSITVDEEKLTFCEGGSVELVSSASTGNQWYKDGNEITGATDQKYVATESGIYTVRFTDANGCYTVSAGVTVVENQLPPPPSITVDQEKLTF
ncbi:MAG: hypothetical protein WC623_10130, partial [Pedobacter sp.]